MSYYNGLNGSFDFKRYSKKPLPECNRNSSLISDTGPTGTDVRNYGNCYTGMTGLTGQMIPGPTGIFNGQSIYGNMIIQNIDNNSSNITLGNSDLFFAKLYAKNGKFGDLDLYYGGNAVVLPTVYDTSMNHSSVNLGSNSQPFQSIYTNQFFLGNNDSVHINDTSFNKMNISFDISHQKIIYQIDNSSNHYQVFEVTVPVASPYLNLNQISFTGLTFFDYLDVASLNFDTIQSQLFAEIPIYYSGPDVVIDICNYLSGTYFILDTTGEFYFQNFVSGSSFSGLSYPIETIFDVTGNVSLNIGDLFILSVLPSVLYPGGFQFHWCYQRYDNNFLVNSQNIVDNAIVSSKLTDRTLTDSNFAENSIQSRHLVEGTITDELFSSVVGNQIMGDKFA